MLDMPRELVDVNVHPQKPKCALPVRARRSTRCTGPQSRTGTARQRGAAFQLPAGRAGKGNSRNAGAAGPEHPCKAAQLCRGAVQLPQRPGLSTQAPLRQGAHGRELTRPRPARPKRRATSWRPAQGGQVLHSSRCASAARCKTASPALRPPPAGKKRHPAGTGGGQSAPQKFGRARRPPPRGKSGSRCSTSARRLKHTLSHSAAGALPDR